MILIVPVIAMIQRTWRTVIGLFEQDGGGSRAVSSPTSASAEELTRRAPPMEGPASAPAPGT